MGCFGRKISDQGDQKDNVDSNALITFNYKGILRIPGSKPIR